MKKTDVAFERGLPRVVLALVCATSLLLMGLALVRCGGSPPAPRAPTAAERAAFCAGIEVARREVARYSADEDELMARNLILDESARAAGCK